MALTDLRDFFNTGNTGLHPQPGHYLQRHLEEVKGPTVKYVIATSGACVTTASSNQAKTTTTTKNELAVVAAKAPHTTYVSHSSEEPWKDQGFYKFRSEEILSGASEMSHWVPKGCHFQSFLVGKPRCCYNYPYHYSYWRRCLHLHILGTLWNEQLLLMLTRRTVGNVLTWKHMISLHQKVAPGMRGTSQAWNLRVEVRVGVIFLLVHFTPTQIAEKLLSGYLINRCQMGLRAKQLWPSDSAFYVASQPVNPAAFMERPLHSDLLLKLTYNANTDHIPQAPRV